MGASKSIRPFAPFEWMVALRYLRARRKASFVSVIAFFSFLGIALGVATLIVVMLSTAETKCAKWRRDIVPVGLRERGF